MKDIASIHEASIHEKVFVSSITGRTYGVIRERYGNYPEAYSVELHGKPFADDGSGNMFAEGSGNEICFWVHESDEVEIIAHSWEEFISACSEQTPVDMEDVVVESVWTDPDFAKQMNIEVSADGWKKKPT